MQFPDQHKEAISKTVKVRNEVTVDIFDDKVRQMGTITVSNGKISISLDSFPSMVSENDTGEFIAASIALGIEACWKARSGAFERLY